MTRAIITRVEGDTIIAAGGPYVITAQGIELISTLSHAAQQAADGAQQSATNAATSAGAAAGSASAASGSATSAAGSATTAGNAKTAAETAAGNAATSATTAGSAATAASGSASAAAGSATSASGSATAAGQAKGAAETAASNAGGSASAAAGSATAAGNSAGAASGSATAAAGSATSASGSATAAGQAKDAAETALNELRSELPNFSYAVTTLAAGSDATLAGSGAYPNITLTFGVPRGADAANPNFTPAVTTLAAGSNATASITGAYPNLILELGIPRGADGSGAVSSVGLSVPAGLSVANSPVTGIGTLTISYQTGYQGYTTAEAGKLSGIASGATANQTDAYLLNRANHSGAQAISSITNLQVTLDDKEVKSAKGAANGYASLDASGKIPSAQLPPVALTEPMVVNNQAAMLALTAQPGDVAIRTDLSKTFMLRVEPATTLANWIELLSASAGVMSVNGQSGPNVTLSKANVGLGSVDDIAAADLPVSNAQQAALNAKATLPLSTGVTATLINSTTGANPIFYPQSTNFWLHNNNMSFTLAAPTQAPSRAYQLIIAITNVAGAGNLTPSGFDYVDPAGLALFNATVGAKFLAQIVNIGTGKQYLYISKASA